MTNDKIWIGSTKASAAMTAARYLLVFMGSMLVARGYISDEQLNDIVGALLVIIPTLWGVYLAYRNNEQKKALEEHVPNSVAEKTS